MRKIRCIHEIIADILASLLQQGSMKKVRLSYIANINGAQMKQAMEMILPAGLVAYGDEFHITHKGAAYLGLAVQMHDMLGDSQCRVCKPLGVAP